MRYSPLWLPAAGYLLVGQRAPRKRTIPHMHLLKFLFSPRFSTMGKNMNEHIRILHIQKEKKDGSTMTPHLHMNILTYITRKLKLVNSTNKHLIVPSISETAYEPNQFHRIPEPCICTHLLWLCFHCYSLSHSWLHLVNSYL